MEYETIFQTFPQFDQFSTHCVGNLSWTNIRQIMRLENKAFIFIYP